VDLFLGHAVRDLVDKNGWYTGVVAAEQATKETHTFYGRLLVAADGHYSKMAALSGVKTQRWANGRFGYYAYFKNLPLQTGNIAQVWFFEPDVVYAFPCDDDLTLITVLPTLDQLTEFKQDIEGNFLARLQHLPDGPDMAQGELVSPILGMLKGEFHYRKAAAPGIAFVGDAAASTDPLWGCGCGWAFQSAEWLVDSMSHALLSGIPDEYGKSLGAYEWKHRHYLKGHNLYNASFANGRKFWPHERFVFTAATKNEACARHLHRYGARHTGIMRLYSPINFARSVWINTFN
jgi:flavin-dependent dehydrogenase